MLICQRQTGKCVNYYVTPNKNLPLWTFISFRKEIPVSNVSAVRWWLKSEISFGQRPSQLAWLAGRSLAACHCSFGPKISSVLLETTKHIHHSMKHFHLLHCCPNISRLFGRPPWVVLVNKFYLNALDCKKPSFRVENLH